MMRRVSEKQLGSSRQASGKLGKCLREDTCVGEREDPRRVMSGRMEKLCNGQSEGGGRAGERQQLIQ